MVKNINNQQFSHAVVEAGFNPVAAMENYVNDIQDKLRKKGYTKFKRMHSHLSEAPVESGFSHSESDTERNPIWWISEPDETSGFELGTANLEFHATNYESRSSLVSELLDGIRTVHEVVSLDHISQLGFRKFDFGRPVESEPAHRHVFPSSKEKDSGIQPHYEFHKSVFKTNFRFSDQNGYLTTKVHRAESPNDLPETVLAEWSHLGKQLTQYEMSAVVVKDVEYSIAGQISLDSDQIHEAFRRLFTSAELAFCAVFVGEHDDTDSWEQGSMRLDSNVSPESSGNFELDVISPNNRPDVRTVPEHIENIRGTLKPKMADLAAIFNVSRQAIYKWISEETTPEAETILRIRQLSRISDRFGEANISRAETLLKMKTFDGLSLMDLIQSGDNTDEHIDALIDEAKAMESAYRNSRLWDSKAKPTDDWLSSISIPGSFEKDSAG